MIRRVENTQWVGKRLTHESLFEVWTEIGGGRSKVSGHVCAMLGANDRVLVLVGLTPLAAEGLCNPVGGTNKRRFSIDVLLTISMIWRMVSIHKRLLTSARCCWPVAKVLSFRAVAPERPEVANSAADLSVEAFVDG